MILLLLSLLLLLLLLLLVLSLSSYYPYSIIILLYNTFLISFPITFRLWNIHILSYPLGAYHLPHDCWICVDVIYLFSGLTLPRPWSSFPCCSQKQCLANAESDTPTLSGITSQSVWKWGIPQKKNGNFNRGTWWKTSEFGAIQLASFDLFKAGCHYKNWLSPIFCRDPMTPRGSQNPWAHQPLPEAAPRTPVTCKFCRNEKIKGCPLYKEC